MLQRRVSPAEYRRIALLALVALGVIIVTGASVRLTGSGLGCSDWPNCEEDTLVAEIDNVHAMVEFVNRLITGAVSIAVILAVSGSIRRVPRRRDLIWWSWGLVVGVVAQIVLGAIVVRTELLPQNVIAHFLLSMVLVWNAVVLYERSGRAGGRPPPVVADEVVGLSRLVVAAAVIVLVTGTIVTGSGPHGGDEEAERLPYFVPDVARIHGAAVIVLLLLAAAAVVTVHRRGAPEVVRRQGTILVAVILAQGAIGYTQYFTGVPVILVGAHVVGAVVLWVAVLLFHLRLFERPPVEAEPVEVADPEMAAR